MSTNNTYGGYTLEQLQAECEEPSSFAQGVVSDLIREINDLKTANTVLEQELERIRNVSARWSSDAYTLDTIRKELGLPTNVVGRVVVDKLLEIKKSNRRTYCSLETKLMSGPTEKLYGGYTLEQLHQNCAAHNIRKVLPDIIEEMITDIRALQEANSKLTVELNIANKLRMAKIKLAQTRTRSLQTTINKYSKRVINE